MKNVFATFIFLGLCLGILSACGVKGKPLPPVGSPYIGSGSKVYSAVTTTTTITVILNNQKMNQQQIPIPKNESTSGQ